MYKAGALYTLFAKKSLGIAQVLIVCFSLCACVPKIRTVAKIKSSVLNPVSVLDPMQLSAGGISSSASFVDSRSGIHLTYARAGCTSHQASNGKLYFLGGFQGTGASFYAPAEYYDPSASGSAIFGSHGTPSVNRAHHSGTVLADGRVALIGGNSDGQNSLSSVEIFDPSQSAGSAWSSADPIPTARESHSSIRLSDGRVVVIGGSSFSAGVSTGALPAEIFNPAAASGSQWVVADPDPLYFLEVSLSLYLLSSDRVLVLDGSSAVARIFDPSAATGLQWSSPDQPSATHQNGTSVQLSNGKVLWVGGWDGGLGALIATTELFDPNAASGSQWTVMDPAPQARQYFKLVLLADGRVLMLGGEDSNGNNFYSAYIFDPQASSGNQWTLFGNLNQTWKSTFNATVLSNGEVVLSCLDGYALLEKINITGNQASIVGETKAPMMYAQLLAPLSDGRVVMIGGSTFESDSVDDVNVFDPSAPSGSEWSTLDSITGVRNALGALGQPVVLPDDRIVVLSGFQGVGFEDGLNNSILDPNAASGSQWTVLDSFPNGEIGVSYARVGTGNSTVLACGGLIDPGPALIDTCYLVNVNAASGSQFTVTDSLSAPMYLPQMMRLADGRVLVMGGIIGQNPTVLLGAVQVYDPNAAPGSKWTVLDPMPVARILLNIQLLPNGKIFISGGSANANTFSSDTYIFDPNAISGSQWVAVDSKPTATNLFFSTNTLLSDGRVVLTPELQADATSLMYIFDPAASTGSQWTSETISTANFFGSVVAMANGTVLIHGGLGLDGLTGDYSIFSTSGYQSTISVTGGTAPYTYQVISGTGTVNASGVVTTGTTGNVTVRVTDALNNTEDIVISF